MKKVLTIAGSDCSGGAGIQADLKTMTAHKVYGMSVITALTAQNTTGVYGILEAGTEFVANQMDCVFTDIVPDAVKIGMVSSAPIIETIAKKLTEYQAKNIVLDPVMVSTSGSKLLSDDAMDALITKLIPLADIITPNLPEAECLCGFSIHTKEEMVRAAEAIAKFCKAAILIKGGHLSDTADDLLYTAGKTHWFSSSRVDNPNTHGTGCTLSSAIACNLAMGYPAETSVEHAKNYITGALQAGLDLGKGSGPLDHCFDL
ncbi:bifunctional hydroxymethylpyrimidine kinase/phosphomethylpyrimidine kinase [Massilimaliae timonensis]|uniref:Hydroxymethylpyrimidine/phosphomethylpyrimidine kinase n=1 Tax=Massiliimalia timonensis TaxID=1987501 RepID=A0A8J6TRC6_9FIRM|nr:bifunctional hydroxymethylpyrimidine kinase/phosphomethylpyrimidine kinase [Massiliimalia timonensis]MBC8610586.1 bifunctional hydroxymethylpyrimidine kinase/phosphomethylpyrimidine kinase [Massiliimalia timonensis]